MDSPREEQVGAPDWTRLRVIRGNYSIAVSYNVPNGAHQGFVMSSDVLMNSSQGQITDYPL